MLGLLSACGKSEADGARAHIAATPKISEKVSESASNVTGAKPFSFQATTSGTTKALDGLKNITTDAKPKADDSKNSTVELMKEINQANDRQGKEQRLTSMLQMMVLSQTIQSLGKRCPDKSMSGFMSDLTKAFLAAEVISK